MLTKSEALRAVEQGKKLVGSCIAVYPRMEVEYLPRKDEANGHPDFYPWHVVGLADEHRMNSHQLVVGDSE